MAFGDALGDIVGMRIDEPYLKLAAAVIKQAILDGKQTKDKDARQCARQWFRDGTSVYLGALTTVTISTEDICQMAQAVFRTADTQVQRRYEAALEGRAL